MKKIIIFLVIVFVSSTVICEGDIEDKTALQKMEIAFDGSYTIKQIKPKLDRAMQLYGLASTEENYSRAGSALVTMRKEYGVKEVDILDYMIRSYVRGVKSNFASMVAISAHMLASGDK